LDIGINILSKNEGVGKVFGVFRFSKRILWDTDLDTIIIIIISTYDIIKGI
jgi:hypothetical protein